MGETFKLEPVERSLLEKVRFEERRDAFAEAQRLLEGYVVPEYEAVDRQRISLSLPLKWFIDRKKEPLSLCIVSSDWHLGDGNHLSKTFWSCVANLMEIIKFLGGAFDIRRVVFVLNGDVVSGNFVYRGQMFRNLVQRGHWQVALAAEVLTEVLEKVEEICGVDMVHILHGTHEMMGENYAVYLFQALSRAALYHGKSAVVNIAEPIGDYNVFFTHGKGSSDYSPVSPSMTRELWHRFAQAEVRLERASIAHTHNLTSSLYKEGVLVDVNGGFQKYEPKLTKRQCGLLLYAYTLGEVSVTEVRPDSAVERGERGDEALEWKNYQYYADRLLRWAGRGYGKAI